MSEIWKYEITFGSIQLHIPITGRGVLSVGQDDRRVNCLWVEVDPKALSVPVKIVIVGTGHIFSVDNSLRFVGTIDEGPLKLHVFVSERQNEKK